MIVEKNIGMWWFNRTELSYFHLHICIFTYFNYDIYVCAENMRLSFAGIFYFSIFALIFIFFCIFFPLCCHWYLRSVCYYVGAHGTFEIILKKIIIEQMRLTWAQPNLNKSLENQKKISTTTETYILYTLCFCIN